MGKAERNRRQNAQEKIAAQQAAARRAENRRRGFIAGGSVVLVLAIVVTFVAIKAASTPAKAGPTAVAGTTQPASVLDQVAHVPEATLTSVGTGNAYKGAIQTIKGNPATLTSHGKAVITYVGGEYCPYCAAERWAITSALSRFGTFSHLRFIHSSSTDVDPSTPTLTFYKSSYTSKYVDFEATEARNDTNSADLQPLTTQDKLLMGKYDVPPYVPTASDDGSFPFVDFANKYVINGASYDPAILKGMTWAQVAAALKDPASPVAMSVDGTTNLITAAICKVTHGQPGNVCTSPGVTKASGSI